MQAIIGFASILILLMPVAGAREQSVYKTKPACPEYDVACYIEMTAKRAGIDPNVAHDIAFCESGLDPYARNPQSTASGVYQFLEGTWGAYCEGNVFNYEDNVDCFMQLFPKNPTWWVCYGS